MRVCIVVFILLIQSVVAEDAFRFREFTSSDGRSLQAKLVSFDGENVMIKTKAGKSFKLGLGKLSKEDQEFVKEAFKEGSKDSQVKAAELDVEQGKIIGPISATKDSSYHLYVPKSLVKGREATLYMVTSAGGGKTTKEIKGMLEISEMMGMITALSVESSNDNGNEPPAKTLPNYEHTENCVKHLLETLPIDRKRIIYGGASGGAANAFNTSSFISALAVINRIGYKSPGFKAKLDYCYGICGSADYNRYYVAESTRDMDKNGFHRFVPGGHTAGGDSYEVDGLYWVHCMYLGDNQRLHGEEASEFIDKALTWLEGGKADGNAYHNALVLGECLELSGEQSDRHKALVNELKAVPENALYHEGLIAFNAFSADHVKTSATGSQLNMMDAELSKKAKELEAKFGSIKEFQGIIDSFQEETAGSKKKKRKK